MKIPKLGERKDGRLYVSDPTRPTPAGRPSQVPIRDQADYERWRQDYLAHCGRPRPAPAGGTVDQLCDAYLAHAEAYYRKRGRPTSHVAKVRMAIRAVRAAWGGGRPADSVRAPDMAALLTRLADEGYVRKTVNQVATTVRSIWRWGVAQDAVDPAALARLAAAPQLKRGRTRAPESARVPPAAADAVRAALAKADGTLAAMVRLQQLGAMRPADVCAMRPADLDRSAAVWVYAVNPDWAKTTHLEDDRRAGGRRVHLGPRSQAVLAPLLEAHAAAGLGPDAPLFRVAGRGRPMPVRTYRARLKRACRAAGVEEIAPNRLRHSRATEVRRLYGLDAARAFLGHEAAEVTEVYAERDARLAAKVAEETG